MTDITERRRPHEEPHVRSLDQQILDTLLRIEELLRRDTDADRPVPEGDIGDRIYNIDPPKTPFMEKGAGALLRVTASPDEVEEPAPEKPARGRGRRK